jgi:UDP-N-acetylglucosamine diphosphorylase / glucose-1-phosphate thymidylyltransferase / UDP-N-acetylgalactosamine diphosphorylase / glucosamine-1-phosphate N-acetyltransferase / galactosamine-1-phosphate N-acetyltransferase
MKDLKSLSLIPFLFDLKNTFFKDHFEKAPHLWDIREHLMLWLQTLPKQSHWDFEFVHRKNKNEIFVEKGAIIEPGALIEGPAYIGKEAYVGHNALIKAGSFLAPRSYVGHSSEINRSILLEGAKAPHFNYVGDSVLGQNVNLGAHATLANLRLDNKDISVYFGDQKIATRKRKVGSFIGDKSMIGCGCVLNPGTIISPGSLIPPLSQQKGFV